MKKYFISKEAMDYAKRNHLRMVIDEDGHRFEDFKPFNVAKITAISLFVVLVIELIVLFLK